MMEMSVRRLVLIVLLFVACGIALMSFGVYAADDILVYGGGGGGGDGGLGGAGGGAAGAGGDNGGGGGGAFISRGTGGSGGKGGSSGNGAGGVGSGGEYSAGAGGGGRGTGTGGIAQSGIGLAGVWWVGGGGGANGGNAGGGAFSAANNGHGSSAVDVNSGGGGGGAHLYITGGADAKKIEVKAGDGGSSSAGISGEASGEDGRGGNAGTNGGGGAGGNADLMIDGTTNANIVAIASGKNGEGSSGGKGGMASVSFDTLIAQEIELQKKDGILDFHVRELQVHTDGTKLTLDGTTSDLNLDGTSSGVKFLTIDLGTDNDLTVISKNEGSAVIMAYGELQGQGIITFDLTYVTGQTAVFQAHNTANLNFNGITIDFTHIPNWNDGYSITLFSGGVITGITPEGKRVPHGVYEVWIRNDNGDIVATFFIIKKDSNGSDSSSGGQSALIIIEHPSEDVINPIIHSISAEPHETKPNIVVLSIDALSKGNTVNLYQWQTLDENGEWKDIKTTAEDTFEYQVQAGTHSFRCIVSNGTGGRTESDTVEYSVP